MKRIVVFLAMVLMLLASSSCSKDMVPLYLKGTTWVSDGLDGVTVIKFDTRRTFHVDVYDIHHGAEYIVTVNFRVAEVNDDQVNFEFASISRTGNTDEVAKEGMMTLHGRRNMDIVTTRNHWREIVEETRFPLHRDDHFNIWNYVR